MTINGMSSSDLQTIPESNQFTFDQLIRDRTLWKRAIPFEHLVSFFLLLSLLVVYTIAIIGKLSRLNISLSKWHVLVICSFSLSLMVRLLMIHCFVTKHTHANLTCVHCSLTALYIFGVH